MSAKEFDPLEQPHNTYLAGELTSGSEGAPKANTHYFCKVDRRTHTHKPSGAEVGAISARLDGEQFQGWRLDHLARDISKGCTILPSKHEGKRAPETWAAQQLFFIDVDNDCRDGHGYLSERDAVMTSKALRLPLALSYQTFSSERTADNPNGRERFRLVFALDEPTRDREEAERLMDVLRCAFPDADSSTTQLNRLFYGTDKEVRLWTN
ncbi:hypothetical protein ACTQ2Q_06140 [Atopobiaceae bacterium LCP21S3_F11]